MFEADAPAAEVPPGAAVSPAFSHEALLYAGTRDYLTAIGAFVREGLRSGEPVMVVVSDAKARMIRDELGADADRVRFADMADLGRNPARIIPAWRDFLTEHGANGQPVRGVGEPIWAERSHDELVECERHEALLNLAFADAPAWRLLCPYDLETLHPAVIAEARRNHPAVLQSGRVFESAVYRGLDAVAEPFDRPLPAPPAHRHEMAFQPETLRVLRASVADRARAFGLPEPLVEDFVLAVNEAATNSIKHGGGSGTLCWWVERETLVCEIRDRGSIADPLVGRATPVPGQESGFGLWLANQLCDLVQIRAFPTGSVVRLHMRRPHR